MTITIVNTENISVRKARKESTLLGPVFSQPALTLNLFLDGHEDGGHAHYGRLHGGHLSQERRLLSGCAGHCGGGDLLGVGGDLGALRVLVGDFHD